MIMKKVVFGGFCLLSGVVLYIVMQISLIHSSGILDIIVQLVGVALAIFGFVMGISGLKSEK